MNTAVILAGGSGARYGGGLPKQYVEVLGKPVLGYVLETFQAAPEIDGIAVVCRPEHFGRVETIARRGGVDKLRWIVPGGENCPESIRRGVDALRGALRDDDLLALHMGVSPLVSRRDIAAALATAREKGCCFTMHPVNICLARGGGADWADTDAPKEGFVELNTPWAFRYGDVYGLYRRLEGRVLGPSEYTLGLWLAEGRRAWYVRGDDPGRLKITTPHDRDLFEGWLLLQRQRARQGKGGNAR